MSIIEVETVSKFSLKGISLQIPKGKMVGVVGPDGSGKTTLMRLMAGLLKPVQGKIKVMGFDTIDEAEKVHTAVGYMPQKFGLYEDLTVQQNLNLYADLKGLPKEERPSVFKKLMHFTGLAPFTDRLGGALSGGMKQKLGLACALIKTPSVLLLDEPSVGVDPISRRELWQTVQNLIQEGISTVWTTSYLDEAEKCHEVIVLHEGKLLFQGIPKKLEQRFPGGGFKKGESSLAKEMAPLDKSDKMMIEAKGLTKKFGNFTAAHNIHLQVPQGEIFGLLGPNGAGKTTIFKMLCGLLKPTSGQAHVAGFDLQVAPSDARFHIGYMAQKFSLYGNLSVQQNLEFFSGIYNLSGKRQKKAIEEMIAIFDLQPYLDSLADLLPLGFKQRLALSCALMHHPPILFLDEATSGVDPITRKEFWNHMHGLAKKGMTIMVTTHFMEEAENCDRLGLVYNSELIEVGTPAALKEKAKASTLEEAFIHLIEEFHGSNKA